MYSIKIFKNRHRDEMDRPVAPSWRLTPPPGMTLADAYQEFKKKYEQDSAEYLRYSIAGALRKMKALHDKEISAITWGDLLQWWEIYAKTYGENYLGKLILLTKKMLILVTGDKATSTRPIASSTNDNNATLKIKDFLISDTDASAIVGMRSDKYPELTNLLLARLKDVPSGKRWGFSPGTVTKKEITSLKYSIQGVLKRFSLSFSCYYSKHKNIFVFMPPHKNKKES